MCQKCARKFCKRKKSVPFSGLQCWIEKENLRRNDFKKKQLMENIFENDLNNKTV